MEAVFTDLVKNSIPLHFTVIAIVFTTVYYFFKTRSLPPGPIGLPFLGFWPFWDNNAPHKHLHELTKKYGDLYSFTLTGTLFINLGSHKVLKEVQVTKSDYFATRPERFTFLGMIFREGIFFANGDRWKVIRKFLSQQFRERGLNSLKGEIFGDTMHETVKETIEQLAKFNEPVDIVNILIDKCCKVMHVAVFGERGITTEEIRKFNDDYESMVQCLSGRNFLISGDIAKYLMLPLMPSFHKGKKYLDRITKQMYGIIDHHKRTYEEGNVRNLIDVYIKEKKERLSKNDPTAQYFTDKALMATLLQIVGDGVVSIAAFIGSFFQALLEHPEEQEKIYKELIEIIGTDRNPAIEDKGKLIYTNAFISEVIRTTDTFPFFSALECTKEVNVNGYRIPKGAITVFNIWSIHHNPKDYEEPEKFNPSRFLAREGKKKEEQPVLFGLGRRACLGEGYTVSQAFLFMTSIVKHYRLTKQNESKSESLLFLNGSLHVRLHPRTN